MTNPTTTLAKIRSHGPCSEGWEKLLKTLGPNYGEDTPVTLLQILDSNGLKDALWALRACNADRFACLLVCDYAEHVLHLFEKEYPKDKRPANAINVARLFANGKATKDELRVAWDAAWDAARVAERKWQSKRLLKYLEE